MIFNVPEEMVGTFMEVDKLRLEAEMDCREVVPLTESVEVEIEPADNVPGVVIEAADTLPCIAVDPETFKVAVEIEGALTAPEDAKEEAEMDCSEVAPLTERVAVDKDGARIAPVALIVVVVSPCKFEFPVIFSVPEEIDAEFNALVTDKSEAEMDCKSD